jgi:hypothetical protein
MGAFRHRAVLAKLRGIAVTIPAGSRRPLALKGNHRQRERAVRSTQDEVMRELSETDAMMFAVSAPVLPMRRTHGRNRIPVARCLCGGPLRLQHCGHALLRAWFQL